MIILVKRRYRKDEAACHKSSNRAVKGVLLMRCGFPSEWFNKPIKSSTTPMEILALRWKVSTLRRKASIHSDGNPTHTPMENYSSQHLTTRVVETQKETASFWKLFGGALYSDSEWKPHSNTHDTYSAGQSDQNDQPRKGEKCCSYEQRHTVPVRHTRKEYILSWQLFHLKKVQPLSAKTS